MVVWFWDLVGFIDWVLNIIFLRFNESYRGKLWDLDCFGISVITDMGNEESIETITHEEVLEAAKNAEPHVRKLIKELILQY